MSYRQFLFMHKKPGCIIKNSQSETLWRRFGHRHLETTTPNQTFPNEKTYPFHRKPFPTLFTPNFLETRAANAGISATFAGFPLGIFARRVTERVSRSRPRSKRGCFRRESRIPALMESISGVNSGRGAVWFQWKGRTIGRSSLVYYVCYDNAALSAAASVLARDLPKTTI